MLSSSNPAATAVQRKHRTDYVLAQALARGGDERVKASALLFNCLKKGVVLVQWGVLQKEGQNRDSLGLYNIM